MTFPSAEDQTLWIKNLNDKIATNEMKRQIYYLFSSVAPIVNIEYKKGIKTRGQAWISFATNEGARLAKQAFKGFNLLGKDIDIQFANKPSKAIVDFNEAKKAGIADLPDVEPEAPEPEKTSTIKATGFPPTLPEMGVKIIFRNIAGVKNIKYDSQTHIAIVQYETPEQASQAMEKLQNYSVLDQYNLNLEYVQNE